VAKFPAPLNDARRALHWLKSRAADFGGDAKRIAVSGGSAGAHLAALLALAGPDDLVGGDVEEQAARGVAADVRAVVSWFPVTDIAGWDIESRTAPAPPVGSFAAQGAARRGWPPPERGAALLGVAHVEDAPTQVRLADPRTYIASAVARGRHDNLAIPPFLILHGDRDSAVGLNHAQILHAALRASAIDSTLLVVADADHEDSAFGKPAPLGAVAAFLNAAMN
jgi:acetyl esterase/lipase